MALPHDVEWGTSRRHCFAYPQQYLPEPTRPLRRNPSHSTIYPGLQKKGQPCLPTHRLSDERSTQKGRVSKSPEAPATGPTTSLKRSERSQLSTTALHPVCR